MDKRAEWKAARAALDVIEKRREEMIVDIKLAFEQERDRRWAKSNARYYKARERLDSIEGDIGEPFTFCEGCAEPIFEGDNYHNGSDVALCLECSPSYEDMLSSPGNFLNFETDEPMTAAEAQAIADAHVAAGGSLTDKIAAR